MLLLLIPTSLFAQNLIVNGDFELGNTGFEHPDYTHTNGVVEAGFYCIDTTVSGHGGGMFGGFLPPNDHTGKYMIVNGWGGNDNPNKVLWKQTVNVTSYTWYTFSFKYANLSRRIGWVGDGAIIQFLINGGQGQPQGVTVEIPLNAGDRYWHTYPNSQWYSGNLFGSIDIEFRDAYTGAEGNGDDFALDNISFVPDEVYTVTTSPINVFDCFGGDPVEINVLNYVIFQPSPNLQYTSVGVNTPQNQIPGTTTNVYVSNNKIYYNYNDASYTGTTADFQYQVTFHGLTYTDSIHVSLGRAPIIDNIAAPENPICEGSPLGIPTPSVTPNATGHWEYSSSQNGPWSELTNPNSIGLELNNKYIHYTASNECGPSSSNAVQIYVSSLPTISLSPQTVDPICEGPNVVFELPTVTLGNNGYNAPIIPGGQGWRIADNPNGPFNEPFTNTNITYNNHNGRYICYYAENDCGPNYSDPIQLVVNATPIVPNINIPDNVPVGVCDGEPLDLTPPNNIDWRHNDPNTYDGYWQVYHNGNWENFSDNSVPSISYDYNGCFIRYVAVNGCGESDPSNSVSITVYPAEDTFVDYTACDTYVWINGIICDHTDEYTTSTQNENGCDITAHLNFTLSDAYDTTWVVSSCDSYYWSKTNKTYYETSVYDTTIYYDNPEICDSTYRLDLTINHAPTVGQLESPNPIEVCASVGTINVNVPEFNPNHDDYTTDWEVFYDGAWHDSFHPESFNLGYGSYMLRFAVDNDCVDQPVYSNSVPFYVSEEPVISIVSGQMPDSVCEGSPLDLPDIVVDWKNMSQSGIVSRWEISENGNSWFELPDLTMPIEHDWWIRYYAQNSCGGASLEPVRVSVIEVEDETVYYEPECDSIMCLFDEVYYYESTVVDEVIDYPCPHIRHHNLVVNHSDRPETNPELIEVIVWCKDEYVWHGRTYYRSEQLQVDQWSTTNILGCDSIRELRLSFGDANEIYNNNQHGCDSYIWEVNDTISIPYYYDENEPHVLDTVFIPGEGEACDTYYYLDLVMGKTWEAWESPCDTIAICKGEEYNGVPYYTDVIIYDTLQAVVNECDSIVSRYLSIIQPSDTVVEIESCNQVWWQCQGQEHLFYEDGEEFTAHLTSQLTGCDSIVTLRFSLTDNIEKIESTTVCEPFVLPDGQLVNQSGPWTYIIPSPDDCDTTVYLNVTFVQTDTLVEAQNACNSYLFHDVTYGPGYYEIYHDPVSLPNGCISEIQLLKLTVKDSEQLGTISGPSNVYVASSLISGIYRYEIDSEGINSPVIWSLSNPDWQILEPGDNFCRVLVTMPGSAILKAHFNVEECGEMERFFEINASFYGVDDIQNEVRIFPNPTKGSVTVEAEGIESLRLTDMMGQVLEMRECKHSDSVILNLGGYTPSVYLLEIKTVYGIAKKRIVLCR